MSAADRQMPETLPAYRAAQALLLALFFSHVFPMGFAALCRAIGIPAKGNLMLALTELYLPTLLALAGIAAIFFRAHRSFGVAWLTADDCRDAVTGWAVAMLGCGILTWSWKRLLLYFQIAFPQQQTLLEIAGKCSTPVFIGFAFFAIMLVPVLEEITFRRALYSLLLPAGKWIACIGGAVIFGILHFFLLGLPGLIFLGIVLQILFLKTRNLAVPMIAHALFNAMAMWSCRLGQG